MKEESAKNNNTPGLNERDVAVYLQEHPEFFQRHESLLTDLALPHPDSGQAVSLLERQVGLLREQKHELARKLQHLAQVARSNEQLLERMEQLILDIIDSSNVERIVEVLDEAMRSDFHADAVAVRLFSTERTEPPFVSPDSEALREFDKVLSDRRPICGHLSPEQNEYLFENRAEEMASGAILPLCEGSDADCVGLLGIGSVDPKRFHPEMGTVFLAHLGAVAAKLIRIRLAEIAP